MAEKLYSASEAGELLGVSHVRIRQLCQEGRIGQKAGKYWILTAGDLEKIRAELAKDPRSKFYTAAVAEEPGEYQAGDQQEPASLTLTS